jgi:hypothetical protein
LIEFLNPLIEFPNLSIEFLNPLIEFANLSIEFLNPLIEFLNPLIEFANPLVEFEYATSLIHKIDDRSFTDIFDSRAKNSANFQVNYQCQRAIASLTLSM